MKFPIPDPLSALAIVTLSYIFRALAVPPQEHYSTELFFRLKYFILTSQNWHWNILQNLLPTSPQKSHGLMNYMIDYRGHR